METLPLFITELVISLGLSTLILAIISKPLINALNTSCASEQQAQFWLNYTRIMLYIAPLLLVIIMGGVFNGVDTLEHIRVSVMFALLGMLIALMIVGSRMLQHKPRHDQTKEQHTSYFTDNRESGQ